MRIFSILVLALLSTLTRAQAAGHTHHAGHATHLGRAPAGIMGDHIHAGGSLMFSYSYGRMHMDGMRDGDNSVSTAKVLSRYRVAPLRMDTEMHTFGAMYAVNDRFSLMTMLPLVRKEMDHVNRMGSHFTTRSDGIGDVRLKGIYAWQATRQQNLFLILGLSAPTGDIDASDETPAAPDVPLPYAMQPGSGTWNVLPGITLTQQNDGWSLGAQALATIRLGKNNNDYSSGDRLELSGWVTRQLSRTLKGSLRLKGQTWDQISGADPGLDPTMIATADSDLQGGTRIDVLVGVNFYGQGRVSYGSRLAIEAGMPVYEDLDGLQMSADWQLLANGQVVF